MRANWKKAEEECGQLYIYIYIKRERETLTKKKQSKDLCKKYRQIRKFNVSCYSTSTHQKTVSSYFNKSTTWHRCKNSSRILYIRAFCAPHQVFFCGWTRIPPSSHRKWDTQHLEIKKRRPCVTLYIDKSTQSIHILHLNIRNLQKSFSTAQRSEEQFCWEANLPAHSTQGGARPRKGCGLILHNCSFKWLHFYRAAHIFLEQNT